jgi:hypothetical protein
MAAPPDLAGDGDDARGNGHLERTRIEREHPGDDLLHHFAADLPIRAVNDAHHVGAADDPNPAARPD